MSCRAQYCPAPGRRMTLEQQTLGSSPLAELFYSAPIGMGQIDANGRLTDLNAEFARLIGVRAHDALHRPFAEIAPANHDRWLGIIRAVRANPGLSRETVEIGVPPDSKSLEVVGWASKGPGRTPSVTLLVSEVSADRGSPSLIGSIERARFAREIHDGLAQDLWLAKLTASKLARHPTMDADGRALCADLLRSIDAGLTEARTAVMTMRSVNKPTVTLSELLERQINEFSDRFGIRAECHLEDGLPIPPRVSFEMLRVVQEALNNVRKHASAHRILVTVDQRRTSVVLTVRDDGVGFDPSVANDGYGRQSMSERAQSIGGRLTVASAPGRGTTVTLRVPVHHLVSQR